MSNVGFSIKVGSFELGLFLGELWLKVPKVCELSWTQLGFVCNRI